MHETPQLPEMLTSVDAVIRALGGTRAVMELTDAKFPQTVNNWRALDRFAANTYVVLTDALTEAGATADPRLWGMITHDAESGLPVEAHP